MNEEFEQYRAEQQLRLKQGFPMMAFDDWKKMKAQQNDIPEVSDGLTMFDMDRFNEIFNND